MVWFISRRDAQGIRVNYTKKKMALPFICGLCYDNIVDDDARVVELADTPDSKTYFKERRNLIITDRRYQNNNFKLFRYKYKNNHRRTPGITQKQHFT